MNENQRKTINSYNKTAQDFNRTITKICNYNQTYDFLVSLIPDNSTVLELACGPAQISKYLLKYKKLNIIGFDLSDEMLKIAKQNIPAGNFKKQSIIRFCIKDRIDVIVNGFGIPYLDEVQVGSCFKYSYESLNENGYMYISFIDGNKEGFEKTSFGTDELFYLYYHKRKAIYEQLHIMKFKIIKEWILDYQETDGSITNDVIIICQKTQHI